MYVDMAFPIGCSSSCYILESLSTDLEWVARTKLAIPMVHILDDFSAISMKAGGYLPIAEFSKDL